MTAIISPVLAFTVGNKKSYDKALLTEPRIKKLGKHKEPDGELYSGGCCWPTYDEAYTWLKSSPHKSWAVYGIVLLNGWDQDTDSELYDSEGHHNLINDSVIVGLTERNPPIDYYSYHARFKKLEAVLKGIAESAETIERRKPLGISTSAGKAMLVLRVISREARDALHEVMEETNG